MLATCRSSQRDLASKNILKAFRAHLYPVDATDGRPARECEIVATYTSIEPNEAGEGVMSTEYFDADGLGEFLLSRPKRANGILQRFVPGGEARAHKVERCDQGAPHGEHPAPASDGLAQSEGARRSVGADAAAAGDARVADTRGAQPTRRLVV